MNGKETSKESFEKYTGLMFLKQLKKSGDKLSDYTTEQKDRNYIFRQRDPLAILITSRIMAGEKLDYIHYNLPAGRLVLFNPIGNCAKIQLSTGFLQQCFMKQAMMNLRY